MKKLALAFFVLALSGCVERLEQLTDETREQVRQTNERIGSASEGTLLIEAKDGMANPDRPTNMRVADAKIVFLKAPELILPDVLGCPLPLQYEMATFVGLIPRAEGELMLAELKYPNVSMVAPEGKDRLQAEQLSDTWRVALMARDLYRIELKATLSLLQGLTGKLKMASDQAQLEDIRTKVKRLILVAPTVLGAMEVADLDATRTGPVERRFVATDIDRKEGSKLLMGLVMGLNFSPEEQLDAQRHLKIKLGRHMLNLNTAK